MFFLYLLMFFFTKSKDQFQNLDKNLRFNEKNFYLEDKNNKNTNNFISYICKNLYSVFNKIYTTNKTEIVNLTESFLSSEEIKNFIEILAEDCDDLLEREELLFFKDLKKMIEISFKERDFLNSSLFEKLKPEEKQKALTNLKFSAFFKEDLLFINKKEKNLFSKNPENLNEEIEIFSGKNLLKKFFLVFFKDKRLDKKKNSEILKIFFWHIYLLNELKNENISLPNKILKFLITIPIYLRNINKNLSTIEFQKSFNDIFNCKTKLGAIALYKETLPFFLNKEMAKDIINRRTFFIKLINENQKFKKDLEEIINKLKNLINNEEYIKDKKFLEEYVQKFIPPEVSSINFGGKNSSKFYYFIWGLRQQYFGPLTILFDLQKALKTSPEINGGFSLKNQLIDNPYLKQFLIGRFIPARSLKSQIYNGNSSYTLLDAFYDKTSVFHGLAKVSFDISMDFWKLIETINSVKNIVNSSKSIKNYFILLKELILLSKKAYLTIEKFYEENNIPLENIVPEILNSKDKILNKNELLNFLTTWNKGIKNKLKVWLNIIFPGNISEFYLNKIGKNYEIFENIGSILGTIDAALTKAELIEKNSTEEKSSIKKNFSLPIVDDSKESFIELENVWLPATNNPVENNFSLNSKERNTFIVSPIAAGKSTMLSTIITALYFANCGLLPAKKLKYTYYKNIIQMIKREYVLGSGISGHLQELEDIKKINLILNSSENENSICFFDEIFNTTYSKDVYFTALKYLEPILLNKNLNTVITTHNPDLLKLTEKKDFKIGIKYIEILTDKINKIFKRTFKLRENNKEENWWIKDENRELREAYTEFARKNISDPKLKDLNKEILFDEENFSYSDLFIF